MSKSRQLTPSLAGVTASNVFLLQLLAPRSFRDSAGVARMLNKIVFSYTIFSSSVPGFGGIGREYVGVSFWVWRFVGTVLRVVVELLGALVFLVEWT